MKSSMLNFQSKFKEAQQWLESSLKLNNPKNTKFYKYENELFDFYEIEKYNAWKNFRNRANELQEIKKDFYKKLKSSSDKNLIKEFELINNYLSKFIETFELVYLNYVDNQTFKFNSIFNSTLNLPNYIIASYKIFYEKLLCFKLFVYQNHSHIQNELSTKYLNSLYSLKECTDLLKIYDVFKNEKNKDFLERLKKASFGKTIQNYDSPSTDRDFLFELLINAYFKKIGFDVCFNDKADIIATKKTFTIIGECKKVTSEHKLEENINKAGKQLCNNITPETSNSYGLIFIDISNCIFKKENLSKSFYENEYYGMEYLKMSFANFLENKKTIIEKMNDKYLDISLGICFFSSITLPTMDSGINYTLNIEIITAENLPSKDFSFIEKELAPFENSFHDLY